MLEFVRPDTLIYTNLGMGTKVDAMPGEARRGVLLAANALIKCYHGRGFDELVHRALKDFFDEQLPFKGFRQNTAFYYPALIVLHCLRFSRPMSAIRLWRSRPMR